MKNNLILIVGKSGCGKSTIANKLEKDYGMKSVKSYTTRPIRINDSNDKNTHTFITDDEYDNLSSIIASTEFNGYRYATTQEQLDECDTYVIDLKGINELLMKYRGSKRFKVVYLDCDVLTRNNRMVHRGDLHSKVLERIEHDAVAFAEYKSYADYIIPNNEDTDIDELCKFIHSVWEYTNEEVIW